MQIPNNILTALTREIDGLLHEGSTERLLGRRPTYDDLKMITRQYIDSAAADRPVPARGKAHGLLQAITPQTGLCEKGHLPWEMRDGQVRIVVEGSCPQCGEWVEPVAPPTHFDWVRAAQVAAIETKNVDFGDTAPIPIVSEDIKINRTLARLLRTEEVDVLVWLNYYAHTHGAQDPHQTLLDTTTVPLALQQGHRLRAEVRKAKAWTPRPLRSMQTGRPSPIDLDVIFDAAIEAGLWEEARRSLLLARIGSGRISNLPYRSSPADQTRSDIIELHRTGDLGVWLINASRLTNYLPGVGVQFAAWAAQVK